MRQRFAILLIAAFLLAFAACQQNLEKNQNAPAKAASAVEKAAAAATAAAPAEKVEMPAGGINSAQIIAAIRDDQDLPSGVDIRIENVKPSKIEGVLSAEANLYASSKGAPPAVVKSFDVLMSPDGRYIIVGDVIDTTVDQAMARMQKVDTKNAPVRGDPNSPVTLVEYSAFFCGYCARAYHTVVRDFLPKNEGKVKLIYKSLPISQRGVTAAGVAQCAFYQGNDKFWKVHDYLFENQPDLRKGTDQDLVDRVLDRAQDFGLDKKKLKECLDTNAATADLAQQREEANSLGIHSTPTFLMDGQKIRGAQSTMQFQTMLEGELAKQKQ